LGVDDIASFVPATTHQSQKIHQYKLLPPSFKMNQDGHDKRISLGGGEDASLIAIEIGAHEFLIT